MEEHEPGRQAKPLPLDYAPAPKVAVQLYRKILASFLVVSGMFGVASALSNDHDPARETGLMVGCGWIVVGVVIRYRDVRIW